jgi:protein-L-isoaspartate(D-aspartate) O-methyltransferase
MAGVSRADRLNDGLVEALRRQGVIGDRRIERAFRSVRRHWFVPGADLDDVYTDRAIVTQRSTEGIPTSSSSQPALMARMLEQLDVDAGMAVLEIGTGTGYNAALLGHLVGPGGSVLTMDVDAAVTEAAERHLDAAGSGNVTVATGDGWGPVAAGAVFDRIEATVGVWDISPAWVEQLRPDGVLVVPLWLGAGQQSSIAFRKAGAGLESTSIEPCGFMRMRGPGAGQAAYRQVGRWTVSVDRPDPVTLEVLETLLGTASSVEPAPALERGWFTAVALGEPDALHLFSGGPDGPTIATGILTVSPPGLAVVESRPPRSDTLRTFGRGEARPRLLDLVARVPAVDPAALAISATPTANDVDGGGALATLVRPNFTFVVRIG